MSTNGSQEATPTRPSVSVLIPTYNSRDLLDRCLATLDASTGDLSLEVVVVDNGSTDGSAELVEERFPHVRLIKNEANEKFAPAVNQALRLSTGTKVLILNSDLEMPPDGIAKLLRPQGEGVVATVPILRGLDGRPQREYTFRKLPTVRDLVLNLLFFRRIARLFRLRVGWDSSRAPIDKDIDVEQPGASCFLIDGTILRDMGGMDEALPLWFNDVDLCKRLAERGYRIRFLHDVSVLHLGGVGISRLTSATRVEGLYADTMAYVRKWHPRAVPLFRAVMLVNLILRSFAVLFKPKEIPAWVTAMPRLMAPITSSRAS